MENKKIFKKIKFNGFQRFLIIYPAIFIVVTIAVLVYLYGLLKDYEASEPNNYMEEVIEEFTVDNIGTLLDESGIKPNEFETVDVLADILKEKIDGNTVKYSRNGGEFTQDKPVYNVLVNDEVIAKCTFRESRKNGHGFSEWELDTISFEELKVDKKQLVIDAPESAIVYVNGIEVSDTYLSEEPIVYKPTENLEDFGQVAYIREYTIENLVSDPVVTAVVGDKDVTVDIDSEGVYQVSFPVDEEIMNEQYDRIHSFMEHYGMYIISMGNLTKLLSYSTGQAYTYLSDIPAVWAYLYGLKYSYKFENESIYNCHRISEDCFIVDIYFDLVVDFVGYDGLQDQITYDTGMTCTYVKTDGEWYVADLSFKHDTDAEDIEE